MFKNWCMGNENLVWRENLLGGLFHLPPPSRDSFPLSFLVDHTKIQKCLDHSIQKTRFKFTWFFHTIVRKGVPASLFKAPTPWSNFSPFLKSLFSFPFFLFQSLLKYFRQIPPPCNLLLAWSNHQPTILGLNKYQMGDFTRSTVAFYQKSIFNLSNPITNRLS